MTKADEVINEKVQRTKHFKFSEMMLCVFVPIVENRVFSDRQLYLQSKTNYQAIAAGHASLIICRIFSYPQLAN